MLLPYEFLWPILRQTQGTCSMMLPELQLYLETCQTIYTCLTNVNTNPEIKKKKINIKIRRSSWPVWTFTWSSQKSQESQWGPEMTQGNHGACCVIPGAESDTSHIQGHRILTLNLNHSYSESVYHKALTHFCSERKSDEVWRSAWHIADVQWVFVSAAGPDASVNAVTPISSCTFPYGSSCGSSSDPSFSCVPTFRRFLCHPHL